MKIYSEYDVFIEALIRSLALRDMKDRRNFEEYAMLVLNTLPPSSTLIVGISADGKLTGHAEMSERSMMSPDRIAAAVFGNLSDKTAYVMSARMADGTPITRQYELAKAVYAVCRLRGREYRDHAVLEKGKWRYIVSEFRDMLAQNEK